MKNEKRNVIYFGTRCLQQMRVEKKRGLGGGVHQSQDLL